MTEARISWREGEAYDDWDRIAGALYESIVLDSIRNSAHESDELRFAPYGLVVRDYRECSYVEAASNAFTGAFIELLPGEFDDFSVVSAIDLDERGRAMPQSICRFNITDMRFAARLRSDDGELSRVIDMAVQL
jgi:hypothetical protein